MDTEKKTGRPPYVPDDKDRRTVEAMLSYGMLQDDVAKAIGISTNTLTKYFRKEVDTAAIRANAKVKQALFRTATGWMDVANGKPTRDSVLAGIFWDKTRGGAMETVNIKSKSESTTISHVTIGSTDAVAESGRIIEELTRRLAGDYSATAGLGEDRKDEAVPPGRVVVDRDVDGGERLRQN